ncbi:uncharacterized protein [Watersipora subatra]|uniref:uncharacterized protein n=1 Tax=Watersipora subatra TaxID=2589382 RepID=UPI00355AF3A8
MEPVEILERRKIESNTVADTDSLVAKYDVLMNENRAGILTEERSVLLFQVLDNLLPHLGVFRPILSKIRDELYEYVFSDEHHTAKAMKMYESSGSKPQTSKELNKVERVPHYLLLKKLVQTRDHVSGDLQAQIDILQERLFAKQMEFEEALETIANRNEENSNLLAQITNQERDAAEQELQISRLRQEMEASEQKHKEGEDELQRCCDSLQVDCEEKDTEIADLRAFKQGYDKLDDAFLERSSTLLLPSVNRFNSYEQKEPVIATRKEHILSDIQTSKKLEKQVLTVMNTMMEQYEEHLEEQKRDLAEKKLLNNPDTLATRKMEREIDQSDQELWAVQERFKSTMGQINDELLLLKQHYTMLEEQLETIAEEEQKSKPKDKTKLGKKKPMVTDPSTSITLDEVKKMSLDAGDYVDEDYESNPFIPHERIFSKYAAMLYYSQDGGKNYYIHQDCHYCDSCHEKTIACPHKLLGENKVILMPHKVTHIRLKRPSVMISKAANLEGQVKAPATASTAARNTSSMKGSAGGRSERSADSTGRLSPQASTSGSKFVQMKNSLQKVWDDYVSRTDMKRSIGRSLPLDKMMSFYEQFLAYVVWQDENSSEEDGYGSVLDNLYQFFGDRYIMEEAKYAAVHDFLSAVIDFSRDHRDVQLFAHSLVGNIDFAACRYMLVLSNYIETIDWQDVEDFRAFAASVYPFIQDEDLESMQMGYVSFSENKVSKLHVFEYILHLTLKGREPRIQDLEQQLMQYPSREMGLMNDEEFSEAVDHILQVPDEKRRKALFSETLLLQQLDQVDVFHVHVSKLACILAYLQLVEQSHKLDSSIHEFIQKSRPTHEENLGVHGHVVPVHPSIQLMTMQRIQNLSFNVARRDKCRKDRMETQNDDKFFA